MSYLRIDASFLQKNLESYFFLIASIKTFDFVNILHMYGMILSPVCSKRLHFGAKISTYTIALREFVTNKRLSDHVSRVSSPRNSQFHSTF